MKSCMCMNLRLWIRQHHTFAYVQYSWWTEHPLPELQQTAEHLSLWSKTIENIISPQSDLIQLPLLTPHNLMPSFNDIWKRSRKKFKERTGIITHNKSRLLVRVSLYDVDHLVVEWQIKLELSLVWAAGESQHNLSQLHGTVAVVHFQICSWTTLITQPVCYLWHIISECDTSYCSIS